MSGGGSGDTTTTSEPWSGQKQHLQRAYNLAGHQFNVPRGERYDELAPGHRAGYTANITGIDVNDRDQTADLGLDPYATRIGVETGGFVPFTAYEKEAQKGAVNLARSGVDPNLKAAQRQLTNNAGIAGLKGANPASGYLNQSARGDYLTADSNPYLRGAVEASQRPVVERFNEQVLPGISGQFGASGRFGSGAHQAAVNRASDDLSRNLADSSTQAYAQNYGRERALQQQAQAGLGQLDLSQNQALAEAVQRNAAISPSLANAARQQRMGNLSLLEGVGGAQGQMAGQLGMMGADPYNYRSEEARQRLRDYAGLVQGGPTIVNQAQTGGGGGTNRTANALGGAATGAAMGSYVYPGVGTAAGAVIGGVGGYFL